MDDDSLDDENVSEERFENHLPTLHESEEGAVYRLRSTLNKLDGAMSVSNALIPMEAYDVGDVPIDANPSPRDLADADIEADTGQPVAHCSVERTDGRVIMGDGPNAVLSGEAHINAAESDVIDDVTNWA